LRTVEACFFVIKTWIRRFESWLKKTRLSGKAHMRHADPQVTLKHYQQAVPAAVKAAAVSLETDLLEAQRDPKRSSARKWRMRGLSRVLGGLWKIVSY
jgi:hypothetical protein